MIYSPGEDVLPEEAQAQLEAARESITYERKKVNIRQSTPPREDFIP